MDLEKLASAIVFMMIGIVMISLVAGSMYIIILTLSVVGVTLTQDNTISLVSITLSMFTLMVTMGWNFYIFRKTSDEYEPVVNIDWINVPPFTKQEGESVSLVIRNVGKRKLVPEKVVLRGSWFDEKIECKLDDEYVSPGEKTMVFEQVPHPLAGNHEIILEIFDVDDISWIRRKKFYVPTIDEMSIVE